MIGLVIELANVDVQPYAAQFARAQRDDQRFLIDDFAARHVDQDGARSHRRKRFAADQVGRLRRPLATDRYTIALRQHRMKPIGSASPGFTRRRVPITRIPTLAHSRPTSRPIPPAPTTHTVLPSSAIGP